jgi:prepilin peptidase CpaA
MNVVAATPYGWFPVGIVVFAGLVAAAIDVWTFKIHNVLTLPLLLGGLLFHALNGGATGLAYSLTGAALGFFVLIVFYALGGVGAGDVKLLAAVGAWLGAETTVSVALLAGLATGMYALTLIVFSGGYRNVKTNLCILAYRVRTMAIHFTRDERVETAVRQFDDRRKRLVPFAAMVAIGIAGVVLHSFYLGE